MDAAKKAAGVRRKGISTPIAALLVSLAALQGGLLVLGYWWLTKGKATQVAAEAGKDRPSKVSAPSPAAEGKSAPKVAEPAVQAAPAVAAAPAEPAEPAPVEEAPAVTGVDESGVRAPTCEELFDGQRVPDGDFAGAAYEQQRIAERFIVRGNVNEAQLSYCKAVRWDKGAVGRYIDLAQFMLIRRDGASAAEWAKRALEVQPGNTRAYNLLGDGLARIGDIKGAQQAWFIAAGVVDPNDGQKQAFVLKAMQEATLSASKRDYIRAERFYRRAITVDPNHLKAALGLASSLVRLSEPGPALRWAQRALVIDPRSPAARVAIGDAHLAAGEGRLAENEWKEALMLDPGYGEAKLRLNRLASRTQ